MASDKTRASYRAEAEKKIRRAQAKHPDLQTLEAIFRYVVDYPDKLTPNTARLWRQQMRIAVEDVAKRDPRRFTGGQIRDFVCDMDEKVDLLRGRPSSPRTSSKKRKDPPKEEVVAVFAHLKKRALALHRARMAATAIYCLLMPRIGGRPVELVGAHVQGGILFLPNAKRAPGQETERPIGVGQWGLHYRVALAALIDIVNSEVAQNGYQAWLSALAEILARACEAVGVERLAPSSFRHTALSTWSAAGLSIDEIAQLAGHFCRRSSLHYIRTASAWGPEDAIVAPVNPMILSPMLTSVSTLPGVSGFDLEPMPQPTLSPVRTDETQRLLNDHRQRLHDEEKSLDLAVATVFAQRPMSSTARQSESSPNLRSPLARYKAHAKL